VSSFNLATLDAVRAQAPDAPTAWLTMTTSDQHEALSSAASAGHRGVNPPDAAVTRELVGSAHAVGLQLAVWTVNGAARMIELAGWGVDAVITDRPALAVTVLR